MSLPEWSDDDRRNDALLRVAIAVLEADPERATPTPAELDVLRCLSHGMTPAMAADALGRAHSTVASQVKSARRRLAAKNESHAVALALRRALID
jgi:DNA-binding CsgD family transcriptional regulator